MIDKGAHKKRSENAKRFMGFPINVGVRIEVAVGLKYL